MMSDTHKSLLLVFLCVSLPLPADAWGKTFTTAFASDESPLLEQGAWLNGRTTGLDWSDVRTVPGFVFGTQTRGVSPPYDDSVAVLTGTWGPAQFAQATVKAVNCTDASHQEVELYLHSTITPHSITGYEFNFRCSQSNQAYAEIVRWNGKINDFTYLAHSGGSRYGVKDGDVVAAIIVGNVLQSFINGVLVTHATDSTFSAGSPGIGFFFQGEAGSSRDFGFSNSRRQTLSRRNFPRASSQFIVCNFFKH